MTKTGTDAKNNEAVKPQTASETAATETTVADTVGDAGSHRGTCQQSAEH